MSSPTDRIALVVGAVFLLLAVSRLLSSTGLAHHGWGWPVGTVVVGIVPAVAARTLRACSSPRRRAGKRYAGLVPPS